MASTAGRRPAARVGPRPTGLVGRGTEWAAALGELRRLGAGGTRWLAVTGEPGIGKTRLLTELAVEADSLGHLVLAGRGAEFEREIPFGVWIDALDDYVGAMDPTAPAWPSDVERAALASVLPSLRTGADHAQPAGPGYPTHRAVRTLLSRLAAQRPVLLMLDDIQWADPASVGLLTHLMRRTPTGPLLVAVAYREGQAPDGVAPALEAAIRDVGGRALRPGPLSVAEAEELLGTQPTADLQRLHADSGGNPFYLQQLARFVGHSVTSADDTYELTEVPPAVAAALAQEIAALSPAARLLAQGAAVAGDPCELDLAGRAGDVPPAELLAALDALLHADLLRTTDVPRRFRFRHPIVRRAAYHSMSHGWRIAAHARAAAALEGAGGSVAARAHHVEQSATPGDLAAVGVLAAAAGFASRSAPVAAAHWFDAALRLLPVDDVATRLELTAASAFTLLGHGSLSEARTRLLAALALDPPDEARVRIATACAGAENLLGEHLSAQRRLLGTLDELTDARSASAAALQVELATDAMHDSDHAAVEGWSRSALELAEELDEPALRAAAAALVAYASCWRDPARADAAVAVAAEALDALTDEQLATRLDAAFHLGHAELCRDRYDEAAYHLQRGAAICRATGQGQYLVPVLTGAVYALGRRGRCAASVALADEAVALAELAEIPFLRSWTSAFRSWAATLLGDLAAATASAKLATELVAATDPGPLKAAVHALAAVTWLEAGELDRCVAAMQAAGAPELTLVDPGRRVAWYELLTRAELGRGDRDAAAGWAQRAAALSADVGLPAAAAATLRAQAALLLHDGEPAAAAELALEAAAAADAAGVPLDAARSRTLAGRALGAAGETEQAAAELRAAESALAGCGARRLRDEAAGELRTLRRREVDGPTELSAREREVAALVAQGRTNRQIATTLTLSEKTIEAVLSRVFGKLGVSSRSAVAAEITRHQRGD